MEVRRTPQTRVATGQRGYAQAAQPLDFSPVQQGVEAIVTQMKATQRSRQEFDLRRRLLTETNDLQEDLERRRRDPATDMANFGEEVDSTYRARLRAVSEEYAQQGYDRDLVDNFTLQLDQLRGGLFESALQSQLGAMGERAISQTRSAIDEASRGVMNNWDDYDVYLQNVEELIDMNPDLREEERIALREDAGAIRLVGARAWAEADPEGLISQLDPTGRFTTEQVPTVTGSAASVVDASALPAPQAEVANALSATGWHPNVVAGFLGNFEVEGGYAGARGDGGTASGIAQWRLDRRQRFVAMFGKDPHEATLTEQAQFVQHEMENPEAAGMTVAQRDAILNAGSPEQAAELIDRYYERSSGAHRGRRQEEAGRMASLITIAIPPSTANQSDFAPTQEGLPTESDVIEVTETNHPLLRDLTGEERLQALSWAQSARQSNQVAQKSAMEVLINNVEAEALANGGNISSPIPTQAEVLQAYGPIEGPQKWARLQQIQSTATAMQNWSSLSNDQIDASLERLRPQQGDPAYATKIDIYEGAVTARNAIMQRRQEDPAQYAIDNIPAVQQALESGDMARYHQAVREAQASLGIPESQRSLYPTSVIESERDLYPTLSAAQRVAKLRQWSTGATEDEFLNFTRQLEGTTAYDDAIIYRTMWQWPGSRASLPVILQGRSIMEQDPSRRPTSETIQARFRSAMFDTVQGLDPIASRAISEAAIAIYVSRGGRPENTQFNPTLYQESLRQAVGGSQSNPQTGWYDARRNGVRNLTILPPLVSRPQFERWVESIDRVDLQELSVSGNLPVYANGQAVDPQDIIDEGVLVMTSPGVYGIKFGPNEWAFDPETRRPYYMRINPQRVRGN